MIHWRRAGIWAGHLVAGAFTGWLALRVAGPIGAAAVVAALVAARTLLAGGKAATVPATLLLIGGFWALSPWTAAGIVLIWAVPGAIRGNPLAGASLAAAASPLGVWLLAHPGPLVLSLAALAALLVVWAQRAWWKEFGL